MTTVLRSGSGARRRLIWSALFISAGLLGCWWANGVDTSSRKTVLQAAMLLDAGVMLALLALLYRAKRASGPLN